MSIRVGLRAMARTIGRVGPVCAARGDMKALIYGGQSTEYKPGGWTATKLLEVLGFTVDTLSIAETVPDLCPYSLLWIGIPYGHGVYSADELAAIQALVEDNGASILLLGDTDAGHDLGPINQIAGIWGCAYGALINYSITPSAGQGGHDLWVTPTKGVGFQAGAYWDSKIITIGAGFTQYANGANIIGIYREFASGGRVVMSLYDGILDHDNWMINLLKWLDGIKAETYAEDFEDLDDWTLTEQSMHDVTIVEDTWVRFKPIASGGAGWSPFSSIVHTLATPIAGDFLFAFNWRYFWPSATPISQFYIQLLDADDNVVGYWSVADSWVASRGGLLSSVCDAALFTGANTMPYSGHFRMSIFRSGDVIYMTSGVLQGGDDGGGPYYRVGDCTRTVAKIKIQFRHHSNYWTATEYYDVDHVILWRE